MDVNRKKEERRKGKRKEKGKKKKKRRKVYLSNPRNKLMRRIKTREDD